MKNLDLHRILFLDIETVSASPDFSELDETWQSLWDQKTRFQRNEETTPAEFYNERAGVLAEFGKIVCISIGYFSKSGGRNFRIKSFYHHEESILLSEFAELLRERLSGYVLCAHNGKEFDFPYMARRMLVQGIELPPALDLAGKKPWEIPHLDTLELWKFGDRKNYTSLKLLAALFDIPTPKDDIDGSQVGAVYWKENDLKRIATYCQKDTLTLAQLLLKWKGDKLLSDEEISFV